MTFLSMYFLRSGPPLPDMLEEDSGRFWSTRAPKPVFEFGETRNLYNLKRICSVAFLSPFEDCRAGGLFLPVFAACARNYRQVKSMRNSRGVLAPKPTIPL